MVKLWPVLVQLEWIKEWARLQLSDVSKMP